MERQNSQDRMDRAAALREEERKKREREAIAEMSGMPSEDSAEQNLSEATALPHEEAPVSAVPKEHKP